MYNALTEARRKRAATDVVRFGLHRSGGQVLAGIRVLVVDDSDINCEVARRILHEKGAVVSLAANGQEAMDWLLSHPDDIDLVLMDVQMPVMDGIEATRRLRQMPAFATLPIVALTAGAFKSQQDAAKAAGMTHFISKPFDVPSTIALIQRLTSQRKTPRADEPESMPIAASKSASDLTMEPASPSVALTADASVMDVALGLEIWSDMPSYRAYLQRFAEVYGSAVAMMSASLAQADRPAATALAHKLAGVAANMALPETRRLAAETERVLRAELDPTRVFSELAGAIALVLVAVEQMGQQVE